MSVSRLEAELFRKRKQEEQDRARQLAAVRLICGIDLEAVLGAAAPERERAVLRLGRRLRRERLKALDGHWSYDLNRHIALGQALERLIAAHPRETGRGGKAAGAGRSNSRKSETRFSVRNCSKSKS